MVNWIKYGRGKRPPPMTAPNLKRTPAGAMDEADCLPFGYNLPPDEPPSQAAIEQVQRKKAAERAAKGAPMPLSETEEYKACMKIGDDTEYGIYDDFKPLLDLIKSRGM